MSKDRAVTTPLYQQIYDDLEQKITTGELRYMQQIPILPDLCKIYGVSDAPVRRALDELERAGLILRSRGRGKGTVVTRRIERVTLRVLLIADFDIFRSAIETCHEVFDLLSGIRDAAAEFGCEVQQVSREGHEHLRKASNGTGYLIIAMSHAEFEEGVRLAESQNAPCVLVNPGHGGQNCVCVDMEQGAFLGTNYLAQLGHRRIAYVGRTDTEWSEPRFAGYQRALALNCLPLDKELIREKSNGIDPQQDWNAMDELLTLPQPPTAIFAASDYRALHLLSYCKRKGISVPEQLSLCGYDDISEVASVEPALTTVRHPRQELGRAAVELITRLLREGSRRAADTVIKPHLVLRESCAPPGR